MTAHNGGAPTRTRSYGHAMLALDYRGYGRHGEPTVVHVNQENGLVITLVGSTSRRSSGHLHNTSVPARCRTTRA
nr:hypothetical protein [Streptomyces antibioticus]